MRLGKRQGAMYFARFAKFTPASGPGLAMTLGSVSGVL